MNERDLKSMSITISEWTDTLSKQKKHEELLELLAKAKELATIICEGVEAAAKEKVAKEQHELQTRRVNMVLNNLEQQCQQDRLLQIAKKVKIPAWASHVAVRNNGSTAEPCLWHEPANDYFDEPIKAEDTWIGGYKHCYWTFFSREQVNGVSCD